MNIEKLFIGFLSPILLLSSSISAQGTYQAGLLPSINLNYKLPKSWSTNFKVESRQLYKSGTFGGLEDNRYKYVLTDYSIIIAKKVGLNSRISGGYLLRSREDMIIHRFIQQYNVVRRFSGYRLAHRIVLDQTFSEKESPEYRLRYRLTGEIPLNGESADPKEFYIKINNEYLNAIQDLEYDLEIRLVPMLGYGISPKSKVELGLDYRVNSFLADQGRHTFWTSLNWYIEI